MKKKIVALGLSIVTLIGSTSSVFACTGTYVGSDWTDKGTTLVARTEDISSSHPKSFVVYPSKQYEEGAVFKDEINGFEWKQANNTYQYFATPDSLGYEDDGIYDSIGFNEHGLGVTATVSTKVNDDIKAVDPLVKDGLREAHIVTLVLESCKTAKEGVELLMEVIDAKGTAEGNIIMLVDDEEVWYMETVSGHQYVAVKLPSDVVSVMPNSMMLDNIDFYAAEDIIISEELISLPEKHGLIKEENGKFSVRKTYGVEMGKKNLERICGGQYFFAPSKGIAGNQKMFFEPDGKVTLKDVMELQKYRYEGTELDANTTENRAIGAESQVECHIIELIDEFPEAAPGVLWLTMGNAEFNIYVPYFTNIDSTPDVYSMKSPEADGVQAYWVFRELSRIAESNRAAYGVGLRNYWNAYQDELIAEQDLHNDEFLKLYAESPEKAAEYATAQGEKLAMEAYAKAKVLFEDLTAHKDADAKNGTVTIYKGATTIALEDAFNELNSKLDQLKNTDVKEVKAQIALEYENTKTDIEKAQTIEEAIEIKDDGIEKLIEIFNSVKDLKSEEVESFWLEVLSIG